MVVVALLSSLACGGKPKGPRTCPFSGTIKAADGRVGVPCSAEMSMLADEWQSLGGGMPSSTGGRFEGRIGADTAGSVAVDVRITVRCDGYAELSRDFKVNLTPGSCGDGRGAGLGEFLVAASTK